MTIYADNFTGVVKVQYRAAGRTHWTQMRTFRATVQADAVALAHQKLADVCQALRFYLPTDFAFLRSQWRAHDTDQWVPNAALPSQVAGQVPVNDYSEEESRTTWHFYGKGVQGATHLYLFAVKADDNEKGDASSKGIIFASANVNVANAISALNDAPYLATSGAVQAVWDTAVTIQDNYFWKRKDRRGG